MNVQLNPSITMNSHNENQAKDMIKRILAVANILANFEAEEAKRRLELANFGQETKDNE